ncbi:hypothetical protein C0J52_09472 [Blattella germanica]|nr:hypothetical protein C0J52_09472 [Blattella germanica]
MYKPNRVTYEIDSIAASHCHRVIRLPPHHCHFNPIELIWVQAREAEGVLETQVEQLIINLNADDSSDEADIDIYEDCDIFPLD